MVINTPNICTFNHGHNILRLSMFDQIFLSPQVKQSMNINKILFVCVTAHAKQLNSQDLFDMIFYT